MRLAERMADYENRRIEAGLTPVPSEEELQATTESVVPWSNLTLLDLRPYLHALGYFDKASKVEMVNRLERALGPGFKPLEEVFDAEQLRHAELTWQERCRQEAERAAADPEAATAEVQEPPDGEARRLVHCVVTARGSCGQVRSQIAPGGCYSVACYPRESWPLWACVLRNAAKGRRQPSGSCSDLLWPHRQAPA